LADLEGLTRALMDKGLRREKIIEVLMKEYLFYKKIQEIEAERLTKAVIQEVENSNCPVEDRSYE